VVAEISTGQIPLRHYNKVTKISESCIYTTVIMQMTVFLVVIVTMVIDIIRHRFYNTETEDSLQCL